MQDALNDVAGTGTGRHREFLSAGRSATTQRWREYFVRLIFQKARLTDFSGIPRFQFEDEASGEVARRTAVSLAGLMLPAVVLALIGLWIVRRYTVIA